MLDGKNNVEGPLLLSYCLLALKECQKNTLLIVSPSKFP